MRGSLLASQAMSRCSTERMTRSLLFVQLASQVEGFKDLQEAWLDFVDDAKATIKTNRDDTSGKQDETARMQKETAAMVEEHEKRLAKVCREMCGALDEHRVKEQLDDIALEQSKSRINEQRTMVHQLVDKSHALQGSLDRTVRKFDEVSTSYAQVQGDLMRAQVIRPRSSNELHASIGQAQEISAEVSGEEQQLEGLRDRLAQMQDDLTSERHFSARLEDFVRRIAAAPPARLRTGGGFQLDSTAKMEAAALLRSMDLQAPAN